MRRIDLLDECKRFLAKRPPKHKKQITAKIATLGNNPTPRDSKHLKGKLSAYRRVHSGEYRIIYLVEDDIIIISEIGKRNDDEVYRRALRRLDRP